METDMKKIIAAAVCALVLAAGAALAVPKTEKFGVPIMTVDEVRPGMKGYGLSVFKGAEPEKFDIEVVAVIKKWRTGNDLIIVRCSGKNLEFTGIAAGMSGSPMYIDDRLIGALAYGWYWPKEAIAGVQPIEHMFELWEMPEAKGSAGKAQEGGRSAAPFSFLNLRGEETTAALTEIKRLLGAAGPARDSGPERAGGVDLAPIATPVATSGIEGAGASLLSDLLLSRNMTPVSGGGAAGAAGAPGINDLKPGSVLGSPLMRGDLRAAAIGTVTVRHGDRILGFGHPFFNEGPNTIPLSGGEIFHFMSTLNWTFKIGAVGDVLGSITDDRLPAISGKIGLMPEFFPVKINVSDASTGYSAKYDFEVARIRDIDASLMFGAVSTALERASLQSEVTAKVTVSGRLEGYDRPFVFEDVFAQPPGSVYFAPMFYLADLLYNPFRKVDIKDVRFDIELSRESKSCEISAVNLISNKFRPGDIVKAAVKLKPHNAEEFMSEIEFAIPRDARPGPLTIEFEGGASFSGAPTAAAPENFDQYYDTILKWIPQNTLSVKFIYPELGLALGGFEVNGLPKSMEASVNKSLATTQKPFPRYERSTLKTNYVVSGRRQIVVNIEKEY